MTPTLFVNRQGQASFVPPIRERVQVGAVFSRVGGRLYFTAGRSLDEIKSLQRVQYQQAQISVSA